MNDYKENYNDFETSKEAMPNDLTLILGIPSRLTWDVKKDSPCFETDFQQSDKITATLLSATMVYSCWTNRLGEPSCQGYGLRCPEHPDTSSPGIVLTMQTEEFGNVVMPCYGLLYKWAIGVAKAANHNGGLVETQGFNVVKTKHGNMFVPGVKK